MTIALHARVTVREAGPRDLPAVLEIESASFSDPWTLDAFQTVLALPHIRFYVAEGAGEDAGAPTLLGYVVALIAADEAEIADLAVAPAARRRGVGGRMLDRVTADAAAGGVGAMYLEVRESNRMALWLYESRGFRPVGRRRAYYRRPREDALLLRRDMAPT